MRIEVSYADFIKLCCKGDVDKWIPGLEVRYDGVWVAGVDSECTSVEHAALTEHPDGDPSKPVLTFPCTLDDIETRVVDTYGGGFIDPFLMAEFVASSMRQTHETQGFEKPLDKRERASLLCIISVLAETAGVDVSRPMKAGETVRAMLSPDVKLSARTIGEHLGKAQMAMGSRMD